jgi:hypothetical protein
MDLLIDLLIRLLEVLFWPAQWWKEHNESSRLGTSPIEKEAEHFWLKVGLAGTLILVLIIAVAVAAGWWSAW